MKKPRKYDNSRNPRLFTIKPYSGGMSDPFSRGVLFVSGFFVGAFFIWQGFIGSTDFTIRSVICLFGLAVFGTIAVLTFTYNELDEQQIASVVRIGRVVLLRRDAVRWDEVRDAKVVKDTRPFSATLVLTTANGKRAYFTVPRFGDGEEAFDTVVRHFQRDKEPR